jgi:hypothetical protein
MITQIGYKKLFDVVFFTNDVADKFNDFYITQERQRIFIKKISVINKILKKQEVYGQFNSSLDGIILIYKQKNFRPYIKILAKNEKVEADLLRFLVWNFGNQDLFIKVKKQNSISRIAQWYGFSFMGSRGNEILLMRKRQEIKKFLQEKDNENT